MIERNMLTENIKDLPIIITVNNDEIIIQHEIAVKNPELVKKISETLNHTKVIKLDSFDVVIMKKDNKLAFITQGMYYKVIHSDVSIKYNKKHLKSKTKNEAMMFINTEVRIFVKIINTIVKSYRINNYAC